MDLTMNKTLSTVFLLLLFPLSVICKAENLTGRFVVEFVPDRGSVSPDHIFSIKPDLNTLSGSSPDIEGTNGFNDPDFPADDKRHGLNGYGLTTTLIESISWQLLCATPLLVAYELALTTNDTSPDFKTYSRLTLETFIAVGSLLNSYWNLNSPMFNPMGQPEANQDHPFAINTMTFGPRNNPKQGQSSNLSTQQTSGTNTQVKGIVTSYPHSDSGGGSENPEQQQQHTFGFNCYVDNCHGVCRFRPPPVKEDLVGAGECPICFMTFKNVTVTPCCSQQIDTDCLRKVFLSPSQLSAKTCPYCRASLYFLAQSPDFTANAGAHRDLRAPHNEPSGIGSSQTSSFVNTTRRGRMICDVTIVGEHGQLRPCGRAFNNPRALSSHRYRCHHSGEQICEEIVISEGGQRRRPCGRVCPNARALSIHRSRHHTGQQTCGETVIGRDGQRRPCGRVCPNARALTIHRSRHHTGQQTCDETVIGEDGQLRPCGRVCPNARALSVHRSSCHSWQQTCDETLICEDGQLRPCGAILTNARTLSDHRLRYHTGQQTCDETIISEDGQPRPCGKLCRNARALQDHKSRYHSRAANL
ncbi:hypothetical protein [Endozoicomonas sp. ONNA1]|uniref:hypothetical protein n=1 Tax=Endozoicomonas sp. ONNA1 TaxID=2828740 RepID=UPI0021496765|nr:hypothetical protein [Endozoicomonas sp. ONNA1]